MEELKEQLASIELSITNVDALVGLKHNILDKKIATLHDRLDLVTAHIDNKLDRVLAYIDKVESPQYTQNADAKEMFINLVANAVITRMFGNFNGNNTQ